MTRVVTNLGEMAQQTVGAILVSRGSFDATKRPQSTVAGQARYIPPQLAFKRACCKTCDGVKCVGHCKF